jgi:hypothetical protein
MIPDFMVVCLVDDDSKSWPDNVGQPLERVVASPVSQTIDGDEAWTMSESHMAMATGLAQPASRLHHTISR